MKLSYFSWLLSISLLALSVMVTALIYLAFYVPNIEAELLERQQNELVSLRSGLYFSQRNLNTLCYDYAIWDEMVEFVNSPTDQFIESNLYENAFEVANVDLAVVYDINSELIWFYASDKIASKALQLQQPELLQLVLPKPSDFDKKAPSQRSGFIEYNGNIVYFSNVTIMHSNSAGDVEGSILMMRVIDEPIVQEIALLTLVDFRLSIVTQELLSNSIELPVLTSESQITDLAVSHSWVLPHLFGQPVSLMITHQKSEAPSVFSLSAFLVLLPLLLLSFGGVIPLIFLVLNPLMAANSAIDTMARTGVFKRMRNKFFLHEINQLSNSFNLLMDKLETHQHYLESLSMQDPLTGIANRRGLESFAARAYEDWLEGKGTLGFLMIDVDYFKRYNDTFGHSQGDRALMLVAQTLLVECRRRGELVTRYGGEEFCVVIHGDNIEQMEALADHMLYKIRELKIPHPHSDHQGLLTISIGGALYEHYHKGVEIVPWTEMITLADQNLYKAKSQGRNSLSLSYVRGRKLRVVP